MTATKPATCLDFVWNKKNRNKNTLRLVVDADKLTQVETLTTQDEEEEGRDETNNKADDTKKQADDVHGTQKSLNIVMLRLKRVIKMVNEKNGNHNKKQVIANWNAKKC